MDNLARAWLELQAKRGHFGAQEGTKIYTQFLARRDQALDKHQRLMKTDFESAAIRHMMRAILYQHAANAVKQFVMAAGEALNIRED